MFYRCVKFESDEGSWLICWLIDMAAATAAADDDDDDDNGCVLFQI